MKYEETAYKVDTIGKLGVGVYTLSVAKGSGRWAQLTLMTTAYDGDNEAPPHPASSVQVGVQPKELLALADEITGLLRPNRVVDNTVYMVRVYDGGSDGPETVMCISLADVLKEYRRCCVDGVSALTDTKDWPPLNDDDAAQMITFNAKLHDQDQWTDHGQLKEGFDEGIYIEVTRLPGWAAMVAGLGG